MSMNMNGLGKRFPIITCSHSLALLSATLDGKHGERGISCEQVYATTLQKNKFALESFTGAFSRTRLDPRTSRIQFTFMICQPGAAQGWLDSSDFERDHYEFCKERTSSITDRHTIDTLVKANKICCDAAAFEDLRIRMKKVKQALSVCPDHCPLAHIMLFEVETMKLQCLGDIGQGGIVERALRKAVATGRKLVTLLKANDFAEGSLYCFEPTRCYIRGVYLLGSFLLYEGKRKEAFDCFQECLANDLADNLGARHKQLLCVLEGKKGIYDERLRSLLRGKFGDDQCKDEIFSLWNYTRALVEYAKDGKSDKAKSLLTFAMDKNAIVPQLLLCWESTKTETGMHTLISIGHHTEANDYVIDSRKFWKECEGALEWLEEEYVNHPKADVPKLTKLGRKLLSEGNDLLNAAVVNEPISKTTKRITKAIRKFEGVLSIAESDDSFSLACLDALEKLGVCYNTIKNPRKALTYLSRALEYKCLLRNEKDKYKEILYQSASCKEALGDYDGALQDYKTVFDKIGPFSTAHEGVKRIESKTGRKSSVIPSSLEQEFPPSSQEELDENKRMAEAARYALGVGNPNDSVAAKQERCFHCKRGGIKLKQCANCRDDSVVYCSKDCQKKSWKAIHKYVCTGSQHRLEAGYEVTLSGLENAPQYNGKVGKIVRYSTEQERFVVELIETNKQMLLKPQNLKPC